MSTRIGAAAAAAGSRRLASPAGIGGTAVTGGLGTAIDARGRTADDMVEQICQFWADLAVHTCADAVRQHGWTVDSRTLAAAENGIRALLLPRLGGGFTFVIDPEPTPAEASAGLSSRDVTSWRLAHEYVHTFFYRGDRRPTRSDRPDYAEERLCDAIATALSGVDTQSAVHTPS